MAALNAEIQDGLKKDLERECVERRVALNTPWPRLSGYGWARGTRRQAHRGRVSRHGYSGT